jgi:hypothetical protein
VSEDSDRASEQALFAARAFVARYERETGAKLPTAAADFGRFAYEMGYLRGRSVASEEAMKMFCEPHEDERKGNDDDTK